ncbi:MAG: phosphonate C-P lyase system protein PhnH [Bosea sp. (in: a-proteobacteria)]|uniref:phosphonate C-P lyase system protein PhnH n=1 Tax=Bosea sp. (in: a-proteobacteria) TaxID=1871050 RepID=UPI0027348733|nr:phosphonate C-P lyase system protein PhnH [Bosea sp. (in: a-proteobacteria)]MDP3603032.1 phosphonate C-P lyase system protein PhnH [Bosea sp. (in: a-proteobacteria)]
MAADTLIGAGFTDPVFQSQAAFRALLGALSEPGTRQVISGGIAPPERLHAATATALLTLADYETPIWLPSALRDGPAGAWLRFHCGAALVEEPRRAAFAVIDGAVLAPRLTDFDPGNDQFPDRSTTIIVQCAAFDGGEAVTLSGPGIATRCDIAPAGLRPGFWAEVAANNAAYPLGVDLLLAHADGVIGLPRSTQIGGAA